jgi:signal peptidase I
MSKSEAHEVEVADQEGAEAGGSTWREIGAFLKSLAVILAIALTVRCCVFEPFKIPSGSMIPTLQIGDYIIVLKYKYGLRLPFVTNSAIMWDQPQRGDVVVFTRPDDPSTPGEDDSKINLIKRVIGTAGDRIEVRGTRVLINGTEAVEPYAQWAAGGNLEGNFGPVVVPEGHILLLGDNRDHSKDSRFWTDSFLDVRRVKGKAVLVFWSWDTLSRFLTRIK